MEREVEMMAGWEVDHLWIFSQDDELVEVLGMGPEACPFFDGVMTETINGVDTLEFSIPGDHPKASHVIRGHVAVIEEIDGGYRAFKIQTQWQQQEENGVRARRFYCEDIAIDELNAAPVIERRPSNPLDALIGALEHSIWDIGQVDSGFSSGSTSFYHESAMSAIQKIVEEWGGEVRFLITHDGTCITGRYVDLLRQRGVDNGRRIVAGKDLRSIETEDDISGVVTALYGYGKGEETEAGGFGRRISFADIEWKKENGDPVDKPKGQEWVSDPQALTAWGLRGGTIHRFDFSIFEDEEDPKELLRRTWEELQVRKAPFTSYKVSLVDLEAAEGYEHEAVRLGDWVTVLDDNMTPPLEFRARIVEIKRYLNEPEKTELTIGQEQPTIADTLNRVSRDLDSVVKIGDPINYLDTVFQTLTDELNRTPGYTYISPTDGILVTDKPKDQNPTSAIRLKAGMLAIANEWDSSTGDFRWRAFGTGNGFSADFMTTGTLNASLVRIHSFTEDQEGGSEITLHDGYMTSYFDGMKTVQIGKHETKYYINDTPAGAIYGGVFEGHWVPGLVLSGEIISFYGGGHGYDDLMAYMWKDQVGTGFIFQVRGDDGFEVFNEKGVGLHFSNEQIGLYLNQTNRNRLFLGLTENIHISNSSDGSRAIRWKLSDNNYIMQRFGTGGRTIGEIHIIQNGSTTHRFFADGTKTGGSIEIDGKRWGMSPVDSPRVLVEDIIYDQPVNEDGVTVYLEERFSKAISTYGVWPSRGEVVVTEKTSTSFKIAGPTGIVDLMIKGIRVGEEDVYWSDMEKNSDISSEEINVLPVKKRREELPRRIYSDIELKQMKEEKHNGKVPN